MEKCKVIKVKKTEDSWTTPSGKVMFKHLVQLEDGRKGWTFSEKFKEGEEASFITEDSKSNVGGVWYDTKFVWKEEDKAWGRSPEEQQSIIRQHSQEMALMRIAFEVDHGFVSKDDYNSGLIWAYTNEFEKDATLSTKTIEKPAEVKTEAIQDEIDLDDLPF